MLESYKNQWDLTIHVCTIKHPRNYLQELSVEILFEVDFNPAATSILEILSFILSGPKLNLCSISYWQVILGYTKEGFALSCQQMEMNSTYCNCDEDPLKYCQWGNRAMTMVLRVHEIFWFILFLFHKQSFLVPADLKVNLKAGSEAWFLQNFYALKCQTTNSEKPDAWVYLGHLGVKSKNSLCLLSATFYLLLDKFFSLYLT